MSGGSDPAAWRLSDELIHKSDRKTTKYEPAFEPKKKALLALYKFILKQMCEIKVIK